MAVLQWFLIFIGTSSAQKSFGVWHLVDVPSVVCPGSPGYATVTISKPASAEYEPHILTVFRTAKSPVELSFLAKDANGIVADQRTPVMLQGHARRLESEVATLPNQTNAPSNGTEREHREHSPQQPCPSGDCPEIDRRLFSMRRRTSSGSIRRRSGGISPVNINPMSWFSPRRRRALSPTAGAAGVAFGGAAMAGSRRRGTAPVTNSFHRRRATGGYGGYSNPYSSYSAPYGYPSSSWAYQSFGGHMPMATSYGYTGANAYSSSSGLPIALAAGAGLLTGYTAGHYWHGYSQADMYKMQCASGAWTGGCHSCVSSYGAHSCNVLVHNPNLDAARDDFMSTGFVPSQISWPLVVNVTHVAGEDFRPSVICPPQDPDAKSAWKPPPMKELFISLSALPSQQPSMLGNGPGYGYGNQMDHRGGASAGVLPAQGLYGGPGRPGQPGHFPQHQAHQDPVPGQIVQGQVVHDPGNNPYWGQ